MLQTWHVHEDHVATEKGSGKGLLWKHVETSQVNQVDKRRPQNPPTPVSEETW